MLFQQPHEGANVLSERFPSSQHNQSVLMVADLIQQAKNRHLLAVPSIVGITVHTPEIAPRQTNKSRRCPSKRTLPLNRGKNRNDIEGPFLIEDDLLDRLNIL